MSANQDTIETAKEIQQTGRCAGIACSVCPLYTDDDEICGTEGINYPYEYDPILQEKASKWLMENAPEAGAFPIETPKAQRHRELLDALHTTFVQKNRDYGDSFSVTFKEFGIISFIVRAQDKWNRIKSLSLDGKSPEVAESLQDTLLDLANYCIMASMELEAKDES